MSIIGKIAFILTIGIVIFIWNKYAIQMMIGKVVKKNPKNKWLAEKKSIITKGFQGFYWLFYVLFTIAILSSD